MLDYLRKAYGYDGGHSLMGVALALLFTAFGNDAWVAGLWGSNLYSIPKEVWDISKHRPIRVHRDNVSDWLSYQTGWPAAYAAAGLPLQATLLLLLVAGLYLLAIRWKLR